jgi:hypothetical protein
MAIAIRAHTFLLDAIYIYGYLARSLASSVCMELSGGWVLDSTIVQSSVVDAALCVCSGWLPGAGIYSPAG